MAVETSVKELWVLDPTTNPEPTEATMAVKLDTLDGKVLGILDNTKLNSDKVLDMVGELVAKRYKLAGVVRRRKPYASKGAPQEMLDEMAKECHFVITGVGDWGSCSSCSVHDGIELEKRKIPAAVILTDLFIPTAKTQAAISGFPSCPFAVIPHPISRLGEDELREKAMVVAAQVITLLLGE